MTVIDSTISGNGFSGISVHRNSTLITHGNTIENNDVFGVLIFDSGMWHQGVPGVAPVPADRDIIVRKGCIDDDPSPMTCGAASTSAISIHTMGQAKFENLDMTGKIGIGWMSLMSAQNSEINGEIFSFKHSGVDLRTGIIGDGTLNCDLSTGAFSIGTIACGDSWP